MKIKRALTSIFAVVALSLVNAGTAVAVNGLQESAPVAQVNLFSSDELQKMRDEFDLYGVSAETQDILLGKIERGQMWDSINPDKVPVATDMRVIGGDNVDIEIYEDGSIVALSTSHPRDATSGIGPQDVTECVQGPGSNNYQINYEGCKANVSYIFMQMGFYFDYTAYTGAHGVITNYDENSYYSRVFGGALSDHRLVRMSDSAVRYNAYVSVAFENFPVGYTVWMQANVTGSAAWTTSN